MGKGGLRFGMIKPKQGSKQERDQEACTQRNRAQEPYLIIDELTQNRTSGSCLYYRVCFAPSPQSPSVHTHIHGPCRFKDQSPQNVQSVSYKICNERINAITSIPMNAPQPGDVTWCWCM